MDAKIWISRGTPHDARFLAAIDKTVSPDMDDLGRVEYWQRFEYSQHPEPANVLVARIGGLYAAYIALHADGAVEQCIQPRFLDTPITAMLLEKAGVQSVAVEQNGMAVA